MKPTKTISGVSSFLRHHQKTFYPLSNFPFFHSLRGENQFIYQLFENHDIRDFVEGTTSKQPGFFYRKKLKKISDHDFFSVQLLFVINTAKKWDIFFEERKNI